MRKCKIICDDGQVFVDYATIVTLRENSKQKGKPDYAVLF